MIEELAKLMSEKNLITTNLAALFIRGVSKFLFADWITTEPKPRNFAPLVFKMFEGNSNRIEHIFQFQQKMALESSNEAILCKVFSTTLTSPTLIWFCQLLEKSINIFENFYTLFIKKYGSHKRQVKTMRDLHRMD